MFSQFQIRRPRRPFTHGVEVLNPGAQALLNLPPLLSSVGVGVDVAVVTGRQNSTRSNGQNRPHRTPELNPSHHRGIVPSRMQLKSSHWEKEVQTGLVHRHSTNFH